MNYQADYFNSEKIEGFEVSSMMKRCWAAQMEVLESFDAVCKKYSVKYFLAYGTLLGAVRHKGFIPWDDDIDIWMLREDIDRLTNLAVDDFNRVGMELITPFTDAEYDNLAYRLVNTRNSYCLQEDFLKKYWLFPFMAGLDIFTLNYLPRDEKMLSDMRILMVSANVLGQEWDNPDLSQEEKMGLYLQLCDMLGVEPVNNDGIRNHLWQLTDRIGGMYSSEDSDLLTTWGYYIEDERKVFRKEWFEDIVELEFEGMFFPCPAGYDSVLKAEFGDDYMIPRRVAGSHDYPYYSRAHAHMLEMFETQGIHCPEIYRGL